MAAFVVVIVAEDVAVPGSVFIPGSFFTTVIIVVDAIDVIAVDWDGGFLAGGTLVVGASAAFRFLLATSPGLEVDSGLDSMVT